MSQSVTVKIFGIESERGRWVFVILGMLINLSLGSIYAWSVFVKPLTDYFTHTMGQQITASDMLLPFSFFLASYALAMPFAGKYIERYGPRNVTIFGGFLTGLGWLLASFSSSVPMLYVMYGIVGGVGVGIAYGVPISVSARWFPDRRGFAVGLTVLGFGISALITANLAGYLIGAYGVMNTFRIFGVAVIVLTTLLAIPLKFPEVGWRPIGWNPPTSVVVQHLPREFNRSQMLKTSSFYALWACYFIGCLAGLMAISIAKPLGIDVGIETGLATILVGFFAVFNGGGRPCFGSLTDKFTPRKAAMLSFALIAMASLLMWQIQSVTVYIISFAILWGCLGGWLAIAPTTTGSFFGTGDYPRCYGLVFLAYGAGAIVGPQLAGFIKTSTDSYIGVFPYVLGLAVIGMVIAYTTLKPPQSH